MFQYLQKKWEQYNEIVEDFQSLKLFVLEILIYVYVFWLKHSFWFICFSTAVHFDLKLESNTTHIFVDAPSTEFVDVNLKKKHAELRREEEWGKLNIHK